MTSSIQTVCCCGTENEYVQFELAPRCNDTTLGCGCNSSNPYDYRSTQHGCGAVDPRNYECAETSQTDCPEPGTGDCDSCGAVYLEKNAYKNMVLHTCDGIDWSPSHELSEFFDGWWLAGGGSYSTQTCSSDVPSSVRIRTWSDGAPCGSANSFEKVESNHCLAPVELPGADPRNPLAGTILSTELPGSNSGTAPRDMTAGNITNLNVDTGNAWFAIVFRVKTGATLGRRRIFDQGDENFGLILDGTTLKACFGSETNSAQEASLATGEWHIVIAKRESGTVSARLNGSNFSTNDVSSTDSISTSQQLKINAISSGDVRFRGQYGELIVAGGTIEDDDIEKMEWYLANRFGLLGNLPDGHPYKTEAPQVTELTPKEFLGRLAGQVFKINLAGSVVPCKLTGGGCLGPQEYTIGSSCKTITTSDIKKDCAGNVMFYGSKHPNSTNNIPTIINWDSWACRYRFWSNTKPCEFSLSGCPETCTDPDAEYDDDYNYVGSEFVKGLHYTDCDDCDDCEPVDATGKFLKLTDSVNCRGNKDYEMIDSGTEWEDPVNLLYGVTNYSNQTRCPKEFDGEPDDCCGSAGSSTAPFVASINGPEPTVTCSTSCLLPDFTFQTFNSPFSDCFDPSPGLFCNPGNTVNACCQSSVQPQVTALSVNFGSFELIAPSGTAPFENHTIDVRGSACGSTCALASGGSGTHICYEDRTSGQGACGTVVSTEDPSDFDPIRCCYASQDPIPGLGCENEGYGGCSNTGYGNVLQGLDDQGIGKINGGSIVVEGSYVSSTYSKDGLPANRGLITQKSYSASQVAAAYDSAACANGDYSCGCLPENFACDNPGLTPMQNGVASVTLTCDNIGDDAPPFTTETIYKVSIQLAFGTSRNVTNAGGPVFVYKKLSTSYDATGTYTLDPSLMPFPEGNELYRYNYPSTITVT